MWRVRDRHTFAALRATGLRRRSGPITVIAVLEPDAPRPPRVAFAISKRVGGATVRNQVRRRLRAAMAELAPVSGAYLLSCGPAAATTGFDDLRRHLQRALTDLEALG